MSALLVNLLAIDLPHEEPRTDAAVYSTANDIQESQERDDRGTRGVDKDDGSCITDIVGPRYC